MEIYFYFTTKLTIGDTTNSVCNNILLFFIRIKVFFYYL